MAPRTGSLEPSSMTITSKSETSWRARLPRSFWRSSRRLKVATTTETFGITSGTIHGMNQSVVGTHAADAHKQKRERGFFALRTFVRNVRGDFEAMQAGRAKYLGEHIAYAQFPFEVVKKIGLQMMVAIRT